MLAGQQCPCRATTNPLSIGSVSAVEGAAGFECCDTTASGAGTTASGLLEPARRSKPAFDNRPGQCGMTNPAPLCHLLERLKVILIESQIQGRTERIPSSMALVRQAIGPTARWLRGNLCL